VQTKNRKGRTLRLALGRIEARDGILGNQSARQVSAKERRGRRRWKKSEQRPDSSKDTDGQVHSKNSKAASKGRNEEKGGCLAANELPNDVVEFPFGVEWLVILRVQMSTALLTCGSTTLFLGTIFGVLQNLLEKWIRLCWQ